MRVVVIGAGVVGLTTAHVLQEAGHEVVVAESGHGVGEGTSYANGAQLSYSYVSPFAGPDVWGDLPRLLLSPSSPVRIRLRADLEQWRWLVAFAAACVPKQNRESTRRLLELAELSRVELNACEALSHMSFDHQRTGKLVVYATRGGFEKARAKVQARTALEQRVLTPGECLALDPFVERIQPRIHGAIFTPSDDTADCYAFCRALQTYLRRPGQKAEIRLGTRIDRIELQSGQAIAAVGEKARIKGDAFVLANGVGAQALGARLGLKLNIFPLKGYSITVPLTEREPAPLVSVTEYERRTVFAPLGRRIRVAGIADLMGHDLSLNGQRVADLVRYAGELTGRELAAGDVSPWTGLRPATPSGLPVIGATGIGALYVNAGHGGFGWTLAMGSARLLQKALAGERTGFEKS
jgi:D-amino-acid dehydrogenase